MRRSRLLQRFAPSVALIVLAAVSMVVAQTRAAPVRVAYGAEPTSYGELLVPPGNGPFPVAVLLHGGCWLARGGSVESMRPMATMLAAHGIASWNVEYRRVGHPGGGWPGSFRDVSDATDFVAELARTHPLDVHRVVVSGHSSGGYFAAWVAGRRRLPPNSPLVGAAPVPVSGAVLLDAFLDPGVIDSRGVDGRLYCGEEILPRLVGGEGESAVAHLTQVSPLALLPFSIPQEYVVSSRRYPVTPPRPLADGRTTFAVADYPALAKAAGDSVNVQIVPDADHFDFLNPAKPAWPAVEAAFVRVFSQLRTTAQTGR